MGHVKVKNVITVNCQIPGELGSSASIHSKTSLMDADFALISLEPFILSDMRTHDDRPGLSVGESTRVREIMSYWGKEISDFVEAGKTIFVLLSEYQVAYTQYGEALSNYDLVPIRMHTAPSSGVSMVLSQGENPLREYWEHFGEYSRYCVYIDPKVSWNPLVKTRTGDRSLGGLFRHERGGTGALVALPWLDLHGDGFRDKVGEWTPEAKGWGEQYLKSLSALDDAIRNPHQATPIPDWAKDWRFETAEEKVLSRRLLEIDEKAKLLDREREDIVARLDDEGKLKRLIFDQGHSLEQAVIRAMRLLGFEANQYRDSQSEFDVVLKSPEGRLIGEVEGKDYRAINVGKMRQLLTNLLEDSSREEVSQPARGILFGNAYRLTSISERSSEQFTARCKQMAEQFDVVLMRTSALFEVARALADRPNDDFATACRKAIFATSAGEVEFPPVPDSEEDNG